MTAKHIMDSRSRKSKKYIALHAQLRQELEQDRIATDKRKRKQARSEEFRMGMA